MGEEMSKQEQEGQWIQGKAGLWSVDPIDGTSNFLNGLPYFAISVALMEQGRGVLGVIYNPVADEMFYATKGGRRGLPRLSGGAGAARTACGSGSGRATQPPVAACAA